MELPRHNDYTLQQVIYRVDFCQCLLGKGRRCAVQWLRSVHISHCSFLNFLSGSFSRSISLLYFLLLICCISSLPSSLPPSPLCPSPSHPGGPSFHHHCPSPPLRLAPPVCKAGVSQDKEDSDYLTKETTGSRGRKHSHTHS